MHKLNVKGLAIALGSAWGFCMLFAGWASIYGWAIEFVDIMGSVYIGYEATFIGAIIGAIWGFVDGATGGLMIAVIYNVVSKAK
ncbi:hypothetical protein MNBD_GAMMA11-108 [hydrothermal vent metagenome]|uniref:Membrane-associated protein n=1 Tax=hydrothermal vent metagenome TaxID=652676 RepID=A0A3B0XE18_9ZZZZ